MRLLLTVILMSTICVSPIYEMTSVAAQESPSKYPLDSGNDLLRLCQSTDPFDRGVCGGYITAVSQMTQIANHGCFPHGMTLEQGKDVVVRYLKDHPESRHRVPATLAARALSEAF